MVNSGREIMIDLEEDEDIRDMETRHDSSNRIIEKGLDDKESSMLNQKQEGLKEENDSREDSGSGSSLVDRLAKATEKKNEYKKYLLGLQQRYDAEVEEKKQILDLLKKKDEIIQKFAKEVERRDQLLDLSCNNSILPGAGIDPPPGVFFSPTEGGQRCYEIFYNQSVPYKIKTEVLSPRIWEKLAREAETDLCVDISGPTLEDISPVKWNDDNDDVFENSVESKPGSELSSSSLLSFISESPSSPSLSPSTSSNQQHLSPSHSKSTSNSPEKSKKRRGSHDDNISKKARKGEPSASTSKVNIKDKKERQEEEEDGKISKKPFILNEVTNVLDIPRLYRINFGASNEWELDVCPIGKKFWYDEKHKNATKLLIKLHDDSGDWENDKIFTVKEQVGLSLPQTVYLKYHEILTRIEDIQTDKRIWLDLRDFDVFSPSNRVIFSKVESYITHFSFGFRLYSQDYLRSYLLLEYIFEHLSSLEYLSINNGMLCNLDSSSAPRVDPAVQLTKLKTLRFILSKSEFSTQFILKILDRAPNLENLYGIPLHLLKQIQTKRSNVRLDGLVRTVCIRRGRYNNATGSYPFNFIKELTCLGESAEFGVEELDTQTAFIIKRSDRISSINAMSRILERNKNSMKKIVLEPLGRANSRVSLKIPKLKNCKSIQFSMNIGAEVCKSRHDEVSSFFPKGFDIRKAFPSLTFVEIYLDPMSNLNFSKQYTPANGFRFNPAEPLDYFKKHFPRDLLKRGSKNGSVPFGRVKVLKLRRFCPSECMPRIVELFPNIRVLRLNNNLVDVALLLPSLFKGYPQLHQLFLEINADTTFGGNLDSALTGLSPDCCRHLEDTMITQDGVFEVPCLKELVDMEKWAENYRVALAITHLRQLHLFEIVVRSASPQVLSLGPPVLSPVSALLGFCKEKMPNLATKISFDERLSSSDKDHLMASLSPLSRYVTFDS